MSSSLMMLTGGDVCCLLTDRQAPARGGDSGMSLYYIIHCTAYHHLSAAAEAPSHLGQPETPLSHRETDTNTELTLK